MNRWVGITLALMAAVVVGRHMYRLSAAPEGGERATAGVLDPLGVQVAHADPLPPVESGARDAEPHGDGNPHGDANRDGGAVGVPEVLAQNEASPVVAQSDEPIAEPAPLRVPLNPEPPLPEKERRRKAAPAAQGPLTKLDPHQMLFEPGEKDSTPAARRSARSPVRREVAPTQGPVTAIDPRQMLFEPGEKPPKGWVRKTPVVVDEPAPEAMTPEEEEAPVSDSTAPDPASESVSEPAPDPSASAATKTQIMKRLLRVMELAGEKP
jgi:hypothetical protein